MTKPKRSVNKDIAALMTKSMEKVVVQFTQALKSGTYRVLPGAAPIVRSQRVGRDDSTTQ